MIQRTQGQQNNNTHHVVTVTAVVQVYNTLGKNHKDCGNDHCAAYAEEQKTIDGIQPAQRTGTESERSIVPQGAGTAAGRHEQQQTAGGSYIKNFTA